MTRKRYIKLLMGKLELSRNEARDRAARVVCAKNKFDARDKTLKALGEKKENRNFLIRRGLGHCRADIYSG